MSMRSGALRHQIAVQTEQATPDGAGGYTLGWVTLATVWADIAPLSGAERVAAGTLTGTLSHRVTIRWRTDLAITTDMRLLYGTRSFNIRAVMNQDERNQTGILLVEEGVAT